MEKIFGIRIRAIIETLLFLSAVTIGDTLLGNGDRFIQVNPHPFWIIIVLISVQYGTFEGIIAAVLSTLFLYVGNLPAQTISETLFEYQYRLALPPLLWFVMAFIVGELRNRFVHERDKLKIGLDTLRNESEAIVRNYEKLKASKENLEAHLVSQQHTATTTYKTLKGLETLKPAQVIMQLHSVVNAALKLKKFSVYAFGPNGLEIATSHGWKENEPYLLRISPEHPLYQELLNNQRIVCIINKDDEKILEGQGIMAGPLVDSESGIVFGMIKIEDIDYMELNISNLETFKTVCELVGMAYTNAREHKNAESRSMFSSGPKIYSHPFFTVQSEYQQLLARKYHFSLSLAKVNISTTNIADLEEGIAAFFNSRLPEQAQFFHGEMGIGHYLILLPFTTAGEAENLSLSLAQGIMQEPQLAHCRLQMTIEKLYQPEKGKVQDDRTANR